MMQLAPMDAAPAALAPIENTAPLATTTTTTEEENNQNTADNNNNNNTNATTNATDFSPRENDNSTSNILPAPNNNDGTFFDESPTNIHPENSTNKKNVQDAGSFDVKIPTANLDDDQAETDSNKKGRGNSEDSADNNNNNDEDLEKNKPSQDELDKQQQEENDGKKKNVINADGTFTIGGGDDADMVLDDFAAFNDNKAPIEIVVDRGRMDIMRPVLEVPHSSYRILFVDPTNRLDVVGDHGYMAIKRAGWTRTQANQYWIPSAMRKDFQAQQLQRLGNKHGVGGSSHQAGSSNGMQQAASNGLLQSNSNSTSQGIFQPQQIGGNKMLNMSNSSSAGHHHQLQNQNQQQALDSQTLVNPATGRSADTPPPMLTFDAIANPDGQVTVKIPEYGEGEYEEDDGADLERASDQTQKGGELDRVSSNKNNNKHQPISALGYLSKASENIGHVDPTCQRFFRPLGYLTRDFVFFEDAMFEEDFFSLETILGQDGEKDEFDITEMAGVTRLQPTAVEPADSELRTYDVPSFVLDALRKANGTDADPFVPPSTYKEYNPLDDDDDEEALGRYVSAAQEEHEAKKRKIEEEKRKIEDEKKKAQALALKKQQEEQERKEEEDRKRRQQEKEREEAEAEAARKKAEEDAKDPVKRKKALLKTLNRFKLDYAKTHNGDKPSAALMKVDPEIGPVYKEYLQLKKMLKKQEGGGTGGGEKDSDGSGGSDAEEGKSTANNSNKPGTPQAASVRPTTVHDQPVTPQSRMKLGGLDDVENDANAPDQDDDPNRVHTTKTVGNNKLDKNEKRYYRNLLKQLRDWKHEFFITRGIEPTRGDMITDHKVSGIILELRKQFGKDEDITISDDEDEMPNDLLARKKWCARKLNQWKQDFAAARGRQPTGKDIKSDGSISKVYEIYKSLKDMDDSALSGKNADNTPESGATPGASVTPQASTTPQVTSMAAAAGSPLGRSGGLMPLDGTGTGGGGLAPLDSTSPSPAHAAGASTHKSEEEIQQEQIQQQHKEMGPLELARRRKQLGLELNRWRAAFLQLNGRKPTSRDVNADPHIKQVYKEYSAIPTDVGANEAANRRQDLAQQLNDWKSLFAQKNGRKPTSDDIQGDEAMAHAYLEYNDLAKEGDDETSKEQEKEMLQAPSEVGGARLPLVAGSLEQDMAEEEKKEKEAARRTSRKHELSVQLNAFKTAFVQRNGRKAKESDFLDDDDIRDAYEEFMRLKKQDDEIAAAEAKAAEELERFQRERDRHQEVVRLLNDWKKQYQMKNGKKPTKSDIENDDEIKEIYQEFVDFQNKKKEQEEHIQHQQQEAEGTSRIQATTVISHHHHAGGDGEDDNATAAAVSQDQQQQQQDTESRKRFLLGRLNAWKTEFKNQHGKGPTAKNIKADPEMAAVFQEYNTLKKQGGGGGDDDDASSPSAKKENGDDDNNENGTSSPSTTNQQQQQQGEEETPAQKKKRVTSELNKWKSNFKSQHGKNPTVKDIKADPTILPIYEAYLSFKNSGGDDAASPSKGDNNDDQQQQQEETTQAATPAAAPTTSTSEQQQAEEESVEDKKKRLLAQLNTWKANFKEQHDGKGPSASDMKADESIYPVFQEYQALKKSGGGDTTATATTNEEQPTETSDETQQQTEEAAPTAAAISSEQPTTTATTDEANTTTAQAQQEESIEDKKKRLVAQLNKWKADFHETHGKKPSGKDLQADDSIRPVFEEYQALKKLSTSHNEKDDDQEEQQQPPATAADAPLQQDATAAPVVDEKSPTEEAPEAGATATEQEQESVEDEKKRLVAQLNKWKADYLATHGKKPSGKDLQADDSIRPVFERYQELKKSGGEEKEEEDEQQIAKKKAEEEEQAAAAAAAAAAEEAEAAAAKQKAEQEEQERLKKEQEEKEEQERVAAAAAEAAAQEEAEKKRLAEEQEAAEAEAKKKKQAEEEAEQQRLAAEAAAAEAAAEKERLEREEQERLKKEQEEKEEQERIAAAAAAAAAEEAEAAAKLKAEQEEQERLKKEQEEQEAATAAAATAATTAAASSSETNVEDRKKELAQKLNAFKKDFKAKNDRNPTADDINADPEIKPIFDEYQLLKKGGDSSPAPKTETETDTATAAPQQQEAETPAAAAAEPSTPAREASNVEDRKKELAQRLNVFKKEFKAKNDRNPTADDINADPEIKPLFDEYQLLKKGGDATSASPAAVTAEASPAPAPSSSSEQQQHQEQTPAPTSSSETNFEDRKKELAQKLNAFKKEFKAKHDRNPTAEDINADPEIKPIFDEYQLLKKGGEAPAPTKAPAAAESESTPAPVAASAAETPTAATTTGADVEERKKELAQKLNAFKKDFKAKNDRNPTADDINADPEIKPIFDEYQLLKKGGDSSPAPKTETPAAAAASSSSTNQAAETSTNINNNSNDTEDRKKHLARQLNAWKTEFKSKNGKGPTADDINADSEIKAVFDEYQAMKKSESSSNSATAAEQQQQQQEQDNVKTASTTEAPDSATATTSVVAGSGGGDVEERKKELARRLNAFKKGFKEKNERGPTMDDIKADAEIAAVFKEYEELKKQVQ